MSVFLFWWNSDSASDFIETFEELLAEYSLFRIAKKISELAEMEEIEFKTPDEIEWESKNGEHKF